MSVKLRKKSLIIYVIIGIIIIAVGLLLYRWPYKQYEGLGMRPDWDVADNIMSAPGNKTFALPVYNLGYATFLHGKGPFTVFVPTDKSYSNLPEATRSYFGDIKNSGAIRQMLLYHVVKGRYRYSDFKEGMTLKTVQGENLTFTKKDGFWVINGYSYIQTYDILAKNGVIHIVTNYLLPPSTLQQP